MLFDWIITTISGVALGLTLSGCVLMRIRWAPEIRVRYGERHRQLYWLLNFILMIVIANLGLYALRRLLAGGPLEGALAPEVCFAIIALMLPLGLLYLRVRPR